MKCAEVVAALTLRRVACTAPQVVGAAEDGGGAEDLFRHCPPHTVADALRTALRRAWLCLELVLAGEDVWKRVQAQLASEKDWDVLHSLLQASAFSSTPLAEAESRRRCWHSLHSAHQAGLLEITGPALPDALQLSLPLPSTSDWSDFRQEEWQKLERLGEAFRFSGHGELRRVLELRWHGRDPLLTVLAAAFFRQALEKERGVFGNGHDSRPFEGGGEDGRELASLLDRQEASLRQWLDTARAQLGAVDVAAATARLERGLAHFQRGEHERAIAEFTAALGLNPNLAAAYAQRGEARRLTGEYELAVCDYDSAHLLDPSDARVLFNRGMVQWILGRIDAAVADFGACLRLDPNNALAWTHQGAAHADQDDLNAALADFTRALQLDPSSQLAYQKRGDLYVRLGDHDRAIADYNQAAKLNPFCALTCIKRGDAYRAKGEHERALADYTSAARLDPLNPTAYFNRAVTYRLREQHDLALVDLNQAVQLDGQNSRVWFERALVHRSLRHFGLALADLDQAVKLSPLDGELLLQRGCTHQLNGDLDSALVDFNSALHLQPSSAVIYHSRGTLQVSRGDIDKAIKDFTAALKCDQHYAQAYLSRASAWSKNGRFDKAVRDCDKALKRDPHLSGAYVVRAGAHVQQGEYEAAEKDFTRALALDEGNAQVYHLRGVAAMKQGRDDDALRDFNESARLNPNNARTLFLRGTVYQNREQHTEALNDFQQAVLLDPSYTAAYCNQRALIHTARGDYELALADYAIVLQLDKTNVTALLGREQALQALQERAEQLAAAPPQPPPPAPAETAEPASSTQAPTASGTPPSRRKDRAKTDPHIAPPTQVLRVSKETDTFPALVEPAAGSDATVIRRSAAETMEAISLDAEKIEELAAESLIDRPVEAPAPAGKTAPDRAVGAPTSPALPDVPLEPAAAPSQPEKPRPVGPMEKRTLLEQQNEKTSERAKLWAEMRYRERVKQQKQNEQESQREPLSLGSTRLLRRTLVVLLGVLLLGSLGFGAYVFIAGRDTGVTAEEVWKEFDKNNDAANKKFKNKWVQVTGKLRIYKTESATEFLFEAPTEDAKWSIIFRPPPKDAPTLKDGEAITVRGRFLQRKGDDDHVGLINCSIIKK
jgi:tetratricopeptide (TPR) repeat protein